MSEKQVAIIGTGDYARALAKRLSVHGYRVTCGSRNPAHRNLAQISPCLANVKVTSIEECLTNSSGSVVFLAVHPEAHSQMAVYASQLCGKVVVDVSNVDHGSSVVEDSNAVKLANLLPKSHVVKGFNTISAYAMESEVSGESKLVYLCGDDQGAKDSVADLAKTMGFAALDYGGLDKAGMLEKMPLQFFPEWQPAFKMSGVLFGLWMIYGNARYLYLKDNPYTPERAPSNITNKAFACTALTLLAITYLPGCLAAILQIINGSKHKRFPSWLDIWMKSRKQLGLLALLFALLHMVMSIAMMNSAYFKPWYLPDSHMVTDTSGKMVTGVARMNVLGEVVLLLGVLSVALMVILGLTSIPAIGDLLNWQEWSFVHSNLGYTTLLLTACHVTVIALPDWLADPPHKAVQRLTFLSCILPWIVIIIKLMLSLPPVSAYVCKIRRGWERGMHIQPGETENDDTSKRHTKSKKL